MEIARDIIYVGVDDHDIDLFEGQYVVPRGMAYNSYAVVDGKTLVFDTVDARFGDAWLANVRAALGGRPADYLVVQHMEPDHSANIARFAAEYPEAKIVASAQAFVMMRQFYGDDFAARRIVVKEGDTLSTGTHEFAFVSAPMVHWPEVIVTYDAYDKLLFSADGFGKFGALDVEEDWACEARRYYIGIVGKYGAQVQALLKKAAGLDISIICPTFCSRVMLLRTLSTFLSMEASLGIAGPPDGFLREQPDNARRQDTAKRMYLDFISLCIL